MEREKKKTQLNSTGRKYICNFPTRFPGRQKFTSHSSITWLDVSRRFSCKLPAGHPCSRQGFWSLRRQVVGRLSKRSISCTDWHWSGLRNSKGGWLKVSNWIKSCFLHLFQTIKTDQITTFFKTKFKLNQNNKSNHRRPKSRKHWPRKGKISQTPQD